MSTITFGMLDLILEKNLFVRGNLVVERIRMHSWRSQPSFTCSLFRITWKEWHLPKTNLEVLNNYFYTFSIVAVIMKS